MTFSHQNTPGKLSIPSKHVNVHASTSVCLSVSFSHFVYYTENSIAGLNCMHVAQCFTNNQNTSSQLSIRLSYVLDPPPGMTSQYEEFLLDYVYCV